LIERKASHHRDGHHVWLILHYNPLYAACNERVHIPNPTHSIHDDDIQSLRLHDHNYHLCIWLWTIFVRDVHRPTLHVHDGHEWAIGNDAALYTDIVSVVLWPKLFIVVRASN
jgi:hypothetical protein